MYRHITFVLISLKLCMSLCIKNLHNFAEHFSLELNNIRENLQKPCPTWYKQALWWFWVPEMRIWSILLIKFDSKWCIHLSRRFFSYLSCYRCYFELLGASQFIPAYPVSEELELLCEELEPPWLLCVSSLGDSGVAFSFPLHGDLKKVLIPFCQSGVGLGHTGLPPAYLAFLPTCSKFKN